MNVPITPETKVGALLDAYPGIEESLISLAPAFAKLKNPVLRKTVAKVATLEQAAKIGGIGVRELVRKLREAAGQSELPILDTGVASAPAACRPAWLDEQRVRFDIDADSMLATGVHPIGKVRQSVADAQAGEIVRLTSSFHPAPLIDAMCRAGIAVYSVEIAPGRHVTYLCREP